MKTVFITFTNTAFGKGDAIMKQSLDFPFDERIHYDEHDIPEFIQKHEMFIKYFPKGYGFYIWKPYIILKTLRSMNVGDILVYCDGGMYLNKNGLERYNQYIEMLSNSEKGIVVFNTNDSYYSQEYVKRDAYMFYYPEFINSINPYMYAGVMIIKNSQDMQKMIEEWCNLCEQYSFIIPTPSFLFPEEIPIFKGQDGDNGLFALCALKHANKVQFIYPDEINIYTENNMQAIHDSSCAYDMLDWSKLDKIPFQCRRNRPRK